MACLISFAKKKNILKAQMSSWKVAFKLTKDDSKGMPRSSNLSIIPCHFRGDSNKLLREDRVDHLRPNHRLQTRQSE